MLILIVCTEGENSEPAFIRQYGRCALGQIHPDIEIVEIPLGGNHGHRKIFEIANKKIEELKQSDDSILSLIDPESDIELRKIIICDYDKMEKHRIDEKEFREVAEQRGYQVIINKPNFEFFVLAYLTNIKYALSIKPGNYEIEINKAIDDINKRNHTLKGFSESLDTPHYSKNRYTADKFFAKLLDYNMAELDRNFCEQDIDLTKNGYTQMKDIMLEIQEYVNSNCEQDTHPIHLA